MDRLTKEDFDVVMDDKQEMECSSSDTDAQRQLTAVEDRSTRTDDSGTTATFQGMRAKNDSHLIQIKASNAEVTPKASSSNTRPHGGYKTFFMLNSAEHEISTAHEK